MQNLAYMNKHNVDALYRDYYRKKENENADENLNPNLPSRQLLVQGN